MQRPGDPIPGSRYVREFCYSCGEPIRVHPGKVGWHELCERCDHRIPSPHTGLTDRQREKLGSTTGG